ncbi:MAG: ATP-dependent RNA helicase HrpA [Phycisphaerales bacterium]
MKPPPSIQVLLDRLDRAPSRDARHLRARILAAVHRNGGREPPAQVLAEMTGAIDRSLEEREERARRAPKPTFPQQLPVNDRREEIARTIEAHQVVVLCGETGSGKTTQLPKICLSIGRGIAGIIGHTQPRRLAARTVAARIADELGTPLGPRGAVGYKVRFGDESSPDSYIKLMTDGILLAETQGDRLLEQYDTIIIDEAHERSLNIDFLLGYLRQLLPRRPDLKVIVTSATIDPKRLSDHFGGPERAPIIEVSGRTYPVEVRYRGLAEREADDFERNEDLAIVDAVDELCARPAPGEPGRGGIDGDILVFLPGEREIRNAAEALRKHGRPGLEVLPLFARQSGPEQMRIFNPSSARGSPRRVVLATNVAETSLTVPGIRAVVDTGYARISRYSHKSKIQRLPIEAISQASANQRSGRCGRVAAGICIRLYDETDLKARPTFTDPEILRTNLATVILRMRALELGAVEAFPFVEPPDARMIKDGYETLFELGAIDEAEAHGRITEVGKRLATLPVDVRIGRMILAGAEEHCLSEVLPIAAVLAAQDPRERPMDKQQAADQALAAFRHESSDFLTLLNIWHTYEVQEDDLSHSRLRAWCREHFLSFTKMREWQETQRQLRDLCEQMHLPFNGKPAVEDAIHKALLTGLLSNIATKSEAGGGFDYLGARGSKVSIFPGSTLFKKNPRWFVAAEIVQTTKLYARTLAKVQPEWIERLAAHEIKRTYSDPHWNAEAGEASTWERATIFGIVLAPRRRVNLGPVDPGAARTLFIHHALVENDAGIEAPFVRHNVRLLEEARTLEAKLRRPELIADVSARFAFFDKRLPQGVWSVPTFEKWRQETERQNSQALFMAMADVLAPEAADAARPEAFPDSVPLSADSSGPRGDLTYRLAPGEESDGITLTLPIESLPLLDVDRCAWLVPGLLVEKVHALVKSLPKATRIALTSAGGAETAAAGDTAGGTRRAAEQLAGVLAFGRGPLPAALSEAAEVLRGISVPAAQWSSAGVPDYLRLRVQVLDRHGKDLGVSRDTAEIKQRLAGKAQRAVAGLARAKYARSGLLTWDCGDLPPTIEVDGPTGPVVAYPALVDEGDSAGLTLAETPEAAARLTRGGVRRLLALACVEELSHRLRNLPTWDEMLKHYAPLGAAADLKSDLTDVIVERAFLAGEGDLRTAADFEAVQTAHWGKLAQATMEVGTLVATVLATRQRIAAKIGSGVPRTWAVSLADIREHAAFLMPPRFIRHTPFEHLRHMPRYVEAVWQRMVKLREEGSPREARALAEVGPPWKRFTGWVAAAHTRALAHDKEHAGDGEASDAGGRDVRPTRPGEGKKGHALPPPKARRRGAPSVPSDIAAWTVLETSLPPEVRVYRWMLEEFRVSLFAQELGTATTVSVKRLDEAWGKVKG